MLFNLHYGQVRLGTDGKPYFRPKRPMGRLMMGRIKGFSQTEYRADEIGNIDVRAPEHIDVMVGLGYPIYDGDGKTYPVPPDDLIWVTPFMDSPYWTKIAEAKSHRGGWRWPNFGITLLKRNA